MFTLLHWNPCSRMIGVWMWVGLLPCRYSFLRTQQLSLRCRQRLTEPTGLCTSQKLLFQESLDPQWRIFTGHQRKLMDIKLTFNVFWSMRLLVSSWKECLNLWIWAKTCLSKIWWSLFKKAGIFCQRKLFLREPLASETRVTPHKIHKVCN